MNPWTAGRGRAVCLPSEGSKNLALAGFHQFGIAAVFAGHLQKLAANLGIRDLAGQALGLIGLKSIMLGLGHESTSIPKSKAAVQRFSYPQITVSRIPGCDGLKSVLFSFTVAKRAGSRDGRRQGTGNHPAVEQ